ncbi:MAG: Maf family protein [Spongiibacteraceae bacterium]
MSTFIYLASQSPRRRELLDQIGVAHRVLKVDLDESRRASEPADSYVQRLAREKAAAGWQYLLDHQLERAPVLGADTAVVIDGDILGKPVDAADAMRILQRLSGRSHEVMTGVAVHSAANTQIAMSCTRVWFRALERDEIENYWLSGEPRDKAGAYGIQGLAAKFIERIEGSYSGVVGLPLFETSELLLRIEKN